MIELNGIAIKQVYPEKIKEELLDLKLRFKENYEMILIGLDGGVEKRYNGIEKPKDIFDLIDSMPMRQSELRRKYK